jgi:hypothetical protein
MAPMNLVEQIRALAALAPAAFISACHTLKAYRVGPNCGPTLGLSQGFSVKALAQASQFGATLYNVRPSICNVGV